MSTGTSLQRKNDLAQHLMRLLLKTDSNLDKVKPVRTSVEQQQNSVQEKLDEKVEDGSKATQTDSESPLSCWMMGTTSVHSSRH